MSKRYFLDLFMLPQSLLSRVVSALVGSISFSDHASVLLDFDLLPPVPKQWMWKLNDSLVQTPEVVEKVSRELRNVFSSNVEPASQPHPSSEGKIIRAQSHKGLPAKVRNATSVEELAALEALLSIAEVTRALARMQSGKALGPDGYSLLYYKTFGDLLTPHFPTTYNAVGEGAILLEDTLQAYFTVIPKEGKDPLLCQNYRPISLLNVDLKILTKVFSLRLIDLIPQLVHSDQVGFVPTREARENTTKAINLVNPVLLFSTDAEKAFDRVNWPFLFETLHCVGLGQRMMN